MLLEIVHLLPAAPSTLMVYVEVVLTNSEKPRVLYVFKKFVQKFCWCQLSKVCIWLQESYKGSQLAGSQASREKFLKLSWSGLLPRPPCVNLSFYRFVSCVWWRRRAQVFLVLPRGFRSFPSVFFVDDKANGGWILFYWRLMLLWVIGVGFDNTSTLSVKWNITRIVSKLFGWVYIILRFPSLLV